MNRNKYIYGAVIIVLALAGYFFFESYKSGPTSTTPQNTITPSPQVDLTIRATSILPSNYADSFVSRFVFGNNNLYGFTDEEVRNKIPEGQIKTQDLTATESISNIKVTLSSTLTTQDWYVKDNQTARLLVSDAMKPTILTLSNGNKSWTKDISTNEPFADILYVWNIMFDDRYKSDTDPLAFWLEYNVANADGFTQVLTLFKAGPDGTLREIKRFDGRNGFVYIDGDTISVGESATAQSQPMGYLGYEKTNIIKYSTSTFKQISKQTIPNVYWTDEWQKWNY